MKIRVEYSDGHYWLKEYTEGHAKAGLSGIDIPDSSWRIYCEHIAQDRHWQALCAGYDEWQWKLDHPEDK